MNNSDMSQYLFPKRHYHYINVFHSLHHINVVLLGIIVVANVVLNISGNVPKSNIDEPQVLMANVSTARAIMFIGIPTTA